MGTCVLPVVGRFEPTAPMQFQVRHGAAQVLRLPTAWYPAYDAFECS